MSRSMSGVAPPPNASRGPRSRSWRLRVAPRWSCIAALFALLGWWSSGGETVAAALTTIPAPPNTSTPAPLRSRVLSSAVRAGTASASAPGQQAQPTGAGAEVVARRCLSCHEVDLISQQRLSEGGWDREITKMVRWGAVVSDEERPILLRYLTTTYGLRPAPQVAESSATQGARIYQDACLVCHAEDLSAQQRLTRAGWVREVEKMMRWGAKVTDEQKGPLADYLTSRWGRP